MSYTHVSRITACTYIFSWLLQRLDGDTLTTKTMLTIIQHAANYADAEQQAREMALRDAPGFELLDCVAVELS